MLDTKFQLSQHISKLQNKIHILKIQYYFGIGTRLISHDTINIPKI